MTSSTCSDHSIDAILHKYDDPDHRKLQRATRRRRSRTIFQAAALQLMEDEFKMNRYPDVRKRETIAAEIGVSEARVQVWFQNRRARINKRRNRSDQGLDIDNVCKRQRLDTTCDNSTTSETCSQEGLGVAMALDHQGLHNDRNDHHLRLFPQNLNSIYHGFFMSVFQASYHQPEEAKTDDEADDIVKRLFRFSSSGSGGTLSECTEKKRVHRMLVPTMRATGCFVNELRNSDFARLYREGTVASCVEDV